jgi:hypothetical protein
MILDRLCSNVRQGNFAEHRAEEFHRIQILLMVSGTPEWRLGTALQEPVRPLAKRQLFAGTILTSSIFHRSCSPEHTEQGLPHFTIATFRGMNSGLSAFPVIGLRC